MIRSFRHKGLLRLWRTGKSTEFPYSDSRKILEMLTVIHLAKSVPHDFAAMKNWQIHPLKGKFEGFWSLRVNRNYRLIFRFSKEFAFDLNFIDYH